MAEIAGLVLGSIPLVICALEKYAEPFGDVHQHRISIETLRTDLILQNRQLQITLANVGLGEEPSKDELREYFENRFPNTCGQLIFIIQRMDDLISGLLTDLEISVNVTVCC